LRRHFRKFLYLAFWGCCFPAFFSSSSLAQKTVTKDAGAGAKEEMDYDAGGRIVGSRTIGPDGKLQVRIIYTYSPNYEIIIKTTNTSYWPDGTSVEKIAENLYDEMNNFVSEIVEDYNQSGKHVSGHQLFHDPDTGIYRCFRWNATQQKHLAIDCPQSEEAHEGSKDTPKITREEVMQHLAAARVAAQAEDKSLRVKPKRIAGSQVSSINEVGVVFPASLVPGQRVSGRVVDDPDRFANQPEVTVTRVTLPVRSAGGSSQLIGWTFELKGADPQPADGPISFVVPTAANAIEFTLREAGDAASAVSGRVLIPKTSAAKPPVSSSFQSASLCFKRDVCVVTGALGGDSRKTFIAFDSVPATIVAETGNTAVIDVPLYMNLGPTALIVAEGSKVEAMMIVVAEIALSLNHQVIEPQKEMITILNVDGVEELSDDQWHYGIFPAGNLLKARALVPGFNPAKTVEVERERREKQEKQDGLKKKDDKKEESAGMVLVVVNNATPDVATMRGAKQHNFVFHLTPESFAMGEFKYDVVLDASKTGTFALKTTAIPFLAPVKAQEFDAEVSQN
jgi:hypothetical protein